MPKKQYSTKAVMQEEQAQPMPMGVDKDKVSNQGNTDNSEILDVFIANGISMIHKEGNAEKLLTQIKKSGSRTEAVGIILSTIISRLETSAAENGIEVPPEVSLQAFGELLRELLFLLEQTGEKPFSREELKETTGFAVGFYLDNAVKSGKLTKEQVIALGKQLQNDPKMIKMMSDSAQPDTEMQETPAQMPQGGMQ